MKNKVKPWNNLQEELVQLPRNQECKTKVERSSDKKASENLLVQNQVVKYIWGRNFIYMSSFPNFEFNLQYFNHLMLGDRAPFVYLDPKYDFYMTSYIMDTL